jgi:hypothetical protein
MKNLRGLVSVSTIGLALFAGCVSDRGSNSSASPKEFYFPNTGVTVKNQAVLLAVDEYLLPLKENVCTYLSTPSYRKEPVLAPSTEDPKAPDQVAASFYGAVLNDNGKFRMWYYALRLKVPGDPIRSEPTNLLQGPVCYAESDDGIQWTKPNLGQVEIAGSKDNNAIFLPDDLIEGVHVIKDDDDPDPQRRYKMVYNPNNGKTWVIRTATSSDGTHWKVAPGYGIDQFLETSSFFHFNGEYIVTGQRLDPSDGGFAGGRQGKAVLSPDFDTWLPGSTEAFLLPEPVNPTERGPYKPYDQVHLGLGAASFGNVAVGLYGIWHNQPGDFDSKKRWEWFGYGKTSGDLGLVISDDGLHFREPVKGHVFMSRLDTPATPLPGTKYPTVLCQSGNGILNVGDQTFIYYGRWRNAAYGGGFYTEVALATLPRDRWGALGLYSKESTPDVYQNHGFVWSAPVRIPASGCQIFLNADHASHITVEISDAQFRLLPNFSGTRSGKTDAEGGIDCPVAWPKGNFAALGGKTVRFKLDIKEEKGVSPRLYAIYLRSK